MEALFIYILKSSGLIAMFYFAYYFLLRKETFFTSSRWFLLAGLITSVLLPFAVYTQIIWIEPAPAIVMADTISGYNYHPVFMPQAASQESFEINWNMVSLIIYSIGFAAFMIKFALDFYSLNSVLKGKKVEQQADFKFIDTNENIAPFSYFDYIVYNSSMYTQAELESILEHEKVHSDQHHTIDVIISRIFCIMFWFNPIIWLYKKAILQNLEFIADSEASKKIADKKVYQYTLLKITTHENCAAITNHFYQSLIKKRIVMLNKNQSKKTNYWKYCAIVPALVGFVLLFQIKTIAQEKKQDQKETAEKEIKLKEVYKIYKLTTDEDLKSIVETLKTKHNVDVVISQVKRNSDHELINIKVSVKKGSDDIQTAQIEGNKAIKACNIVVITEDDGTKNVHLFADAAPGSPMTISDRKTVTHSTQDGEDDEDAPAPPAPPTPPTSPTPPTPPTAPSFPEGAMPPAPPASMAKMPKPPVAPSNINDKAAMKKFEKEMAEFEKKMEAFEPVMASYDKQVNEIMEKRSANFDKEMEQYEIAMEKYNIDMEKFGQDMEQKFGADSEFAKNMKQFEIEMKQQEKQMKLQQKQMRLQQREMRLQQRESRKS